MDTLNVDPKYQPSLERPCVCTICNRGYPSKKWLNRHIKDAHSERKFMCELCNKGFKTKSALIGHAKIHSDIMPYICEICNKGFKVKYRLKCHMESQHLNPMQLISCTICKEKFKRKYDWDRHMAWHERQRISGEDVRVKRRRILVTFDMAYALIKSKIEQAGGILSSQEQCQADWNDQNGLRTRHGQQPFPKRRIPCNRQFEYTNSDGKLCLSPSYRALENGKSRLRTKEQISAALSATKQLVPKELRQQHYKEGLFNEYFDQAVTAYALTIGQYIEVLPCPDGISVDLIARLRQSDGSWNDEWAGIQVKTCICKPGKPVRFGHIQDKHTREMILLCVGQEIRDGKSVPVCHWVFPDHSFQNVSGIEVSLTATRHGKYEKYRVDWTTLLDIVISYTKSPRVFKTRDQWFYSDGSCAKIDIGLQVQKCFENMAGTWVRNPYLQNAAIDCYYQSGSRRIAISLKTATGKRDYYTFGTGKTMAKDVDIVVVGFRQDNIFVKLGIMHKSQVDWSKGGFHWCKEQFPGIIVSTREELHTALSQIMDANNATTMTGQSE